MKDSEVHLKYFWLIEAFSISILMYCLVGLVDRVLASYIRGPRIKSRKEPFFLTQKNLGIFLNISRTINFGTFPSIPFHITTGHLHYRVYLGISADFCDSVAAGSELSGFSRYSTYVISADLFQVPVQKISYSTLLLYLLITDIVLNIVY